jgi:hypothetical protein
VQLVGGDVEAHQLAGEVLGVDELVGELLLVALGGFEQPLQLLDAGGVGAHRRGGSPPRPHHLLHHLGELRRLAEQGTQLRQGVGQLGLRQPRRGGVAALGGDGRLGEGGAQAGRALKRCVSTG